MASIIRSCSGVILRNLLVNFSTAISVWIVSVNRIVSLETCKVSQIFFNVSSDMPERPRSNAPNKPCTQGQFLLFLWRVNGAPEPGIANPFNNTINGAYYKPVLWGYQQGMVSGYSFNTNVECNLGMVLTSLWLAAGRPAPDALTWAVENGLNKGAGISTFPANHICSRGQVMVLLYNLHNLSGNNRRVDEPYYDDYDYDDDDREDDNDNNNSGNRDLRVDVAGLSKAASIAGNSYSMEFSLSATASGGSGDYEYFFEVIQNGEVTNASDDWGVENAIRTRISGVGSCEVRITVRDSSGKTASTVVDLLERSDSSSFGSSISSGFWGTGRR